MTEIDPRPSVNFAVVRRGFDTRQVEDHLARVDADVAIVVADRVAAMEQVELLNNQLEATRGELDVALAEAERLRQTVRLMSGPTDSVARMDERLQAVQRLAHIEFAERQSAAVVDVDRIIAEAGDGLGGGRTPNADGHDPGWPAAGGDAERELHRRNQDAIEERCRLDQAAAADRAELDEQFRHVLGLRCREALAQITRLHREAAATARRLLDEADEQVATRLREVGGAADRRIAEARIEVDALRALQTQLLQQLGASRNLISQAIPEVAPVASTPTGQEPQPPTERPVDGPDVPAPGAEPTAERADDPAPSSLRRGPTLLRSPNEWYDGP